MAKTAPLLKDSRWWAISERALREALAAVASGASWRSVMADLIAESRLDEGD